MMRSTKIPVLVSLGLLLALPGPPTPAVAGPAPKVAVCHIPPGDPGNFHTILVSDNALPAHLAHGDFVGACGLYCETLCDDNDACTADSCDDSEQCVHAAADCNDGNTCTADSCDPASGCVNVPLTGDACAVTDENPCTTGDGTCDASGECVPVRVAGCCNTAADCEPDRNPCTEPPQCIDNACVEAPVDCDTGNLCAPGYCDPTTGNCEVSEAVCKQNPCYTATCDPSSGDCVVTRIDGCCLSDADCDDGNACTTDTCVDQTCSNENSYKLPDACHVYVSSNDECVLEPKNCDDGDACTADSCDPDVGCVNTPSLYCDCVTSSSCSDCCQAAGDAAARDCLNTCSTTLECSKCGALSASICNSCLDSTCGTVPPLFQCQ
jgi:hypothetical protein